MGPHGRRLAEEVDEDEDRHAGEVLPLAGLLVPPHPVPAAHDVLPHTVTGKLEIKANSEARRLPDCGPGRDEGVAAATIIGELRQRLCDNLTRPHRSATQEAGHQVGVAGRGVTLKYVPFNITTDFCK